ncbi:MAG: hypothetical protein M1305_06190, partial [Candidatus Marsarchaeota archaeon]|nr:hypothetical protein [Candidatus Marsarchaeota archaeon]
MARLQPPMAMMPSGLQTDDLLRRSTLDDVAARPIGEREILQCVDLAAQSGVVRLRKDRGDDMRHKAHLHLLEFHRHAAKLIANPCECELPLEARIRQFTFSSRADAVWRDGDTLVLAKWNLNAPEKHDHLMDLSFLRAGFRQRFPSCSVRHLSVVFEPSLA